MVVYIYGGDYMAIMPQEVAILSNQVFKGRVKG
jgi:hypothetical protein